MVLFRCFALVCLAASASAATERSPLADLADRARALPPEFAADALLRIAAAPTRADVAWRRGVIEESFRLAAGAQQPFARRNWTGTSTGIFDKAFAQGLDACTLECRAVHAMLALDAKKARELFAEIPAPQLPPLSCEDALVYDVSVFYDTLGEVAQRTFSAKEVAEEEPVHLLVRYVADLTSPVQAGPIARILAGASLKPAQLEALADSFAGALKQLSGDDRAFSSTISGQGDGAAVEALAAACTRRHISPLPLLDAWRGYLVRHLGGARCADSGNQPSANISSGMVTGGASPPVLSGLPEAVRFFNENMRTGELRAISGDEVQPSKTEGKASAAGQCDSPQCRQLAAQYAGLLLGPEGLALSAEQKGGAEWAVKLRAFLAALADWKGDDPAECFQWKSRFYIDLFALASNGSDRDLLLSTLLTWLQQNNYQRDHRVEWFYPVNVLIIRTFADPLGMKTTMRELRNSTDPVISLYAQLEQVLPRPIERTVGLL